MQVITNTTIIHATIYQNIPEITIKVHVKQQLKFQTSIIFGKFIFVFCIFYARGHKK